LFGFVFPYMKLLLLAVVAVVVEVAGARGWWSMIGGGCTRRDDKADDSRGDRGVPEAGVGAVVTVDGTGGACGDGDASAARSPCKNSRAALRKARWSFLPD
jgi:hypothetical protein